MIIGNLLSNNLEIEILPSVIREVLDLLKRINFKDLENGKYEILKNKIYLIINEYYTKKPEEKKAEQHKIQIDVQYIISGKECIGIGYDNNDNEILDNYDLNKDRISFKTVKNENHIVLQEGMYAIFFPTDIHRPELNIGGKQKVKKVVVKIDKSLLHKEDIGLNNHFH